jgi:predicted TIM-barrel fold metal-dependent hydrolase
VPIILDHMAHPDVAAGVNSPGFQALLALARYPRVFVKPTGYYYYSKQWWPFEDCWTLFRAVYDAFGADRLIWGSDFPHSLLRTDYGRNLHLQERVHTYLSAHELNRIMGENAVELYWT